MAHKAKPLFSPPSPGEILKNYVVGKSGDKRITQEELAQAIGMSRLSVNELLNGKRPVTARTAVKLGRVLGTSAAMWLELQNRRDLFNAEQYLKDELKKMPVLRAG